MALPTTRMSLIAVALVTVLVLAMAGESANAQESSFGNTDTNGSFGQTPIGRAFSGLNPMNWRMPKMPSFQQVMPTMDEKARIKKKKSSLVTEVSDTASRSWNKTKEVLNPKRLMPTNLFGAKPEPPKQPEVRQVGFFESLLNPSLSKPKPSNSVNDFLKQKKPIDQ